MDEERPFDRMIAKVPRTDTDGNDITEYGFGPGGRRRADGTIAGLASDFEPYDEDGEDDDLGAALARLVIVVGAFSAGVGAMKAWQWYQSKRQKRQAAEATSAPPPAETTVNEPTSVTLDSAGSSSSPHRVGLPTEFEEVLDECRAHMTTEEFQKRVVAMLWAAAYVAQEARDLSRAEIIDDGVRIELAGRLNQLTAPWVSDMANRALEANPTLLNESETSAFLSWFEGGATRDGHYIPIHPEQVRNGLCLDRETREQEAEAPGT